MALQVVRLFFRMLCMRFVFIDECYRGQEIQIIQYGIRSAGKYSSQFSVLQGNRRVGHVKFCMVFHIQVILVKIIHVNIKISSIDIKTAVVLYVYMAVEGNGILYSDNAVVKEKTDVIHGKFAVGNIQRACTEGGKSPVYSDI